MSRHLFPILFVLGCTNLDPLKDPHGVVIGSVDTGVQASSTEDTGDTTTDCEGLPVGFESTLDRGRSCGDFYLERHNEDGTMQVTFSTVSLPALLAEARAAMETQVTVIDLADAGRVRISIGENLGADACGTCEPMEVRHHTYAAIAGTAEVEVTPHYDEDEDEETLWRAFATVRLSGVVLSDADSCELTLDDIDLSGWGGALLPIG